MANTITNMRDASGVIAKMAAQMLSDKTHFCKSIDKADVSDFDGKNGYQAGSTIQISKPARFIPSTSADITGSVQDIIEETTSLVLDTRKVVPIALTSEEVFTELGLKKWATRVLDPAVSSIANHVEASFLSKAINATSNLVGTAGTETFTVDTMLAANQKITEFGCDSLDDRFALLNPFATRKAVVDRKGLFQSSEEIAKQYKKGYIGTADGFDYLSNNHLPTVTNGSDVTGLAINDAAVAEGTLTLVIDGAAAAPAVGSVFTIAGVNAVHPITRADLGFLKQFVVASATTVLITLTERIYAASSLKNITALPADNAALVFVGSASTGYVQNFAFHKNAFRMVSVPLMLPSDSEYVAQETVDGMTVRVWMKSDIMTDKMIARVDFLGGLAAVRPEWACRITA